jgi:catechol 2,3-dioxygenase-like lactoylglutathione lyase family enzyme
MSMMDVDPAHPGIEGVAIYSNNFPAMRRFYAEELGAVAAGDNPAGPHLHMYRFNLYSTQLRIRDCSVPLPSPAPGGFSALTVAHQGTGAPRTLVDPDGTTVHLVPPGHNGITELEFEVSVSERAPFDRFLGDQLDLTRLPDGRYQAGRTLISLKLDPVVRPVQRPYFTDPEVLRAAMVRQGYRCLTFGVRDCQAEYRRLMAAGVNMLRGPNRSAALETIIYADPDGNFWETLQRF